MGKGKIKELYGEFFSGRGGAGFSAGKVSLCFFVLLSLVSLLSAPGAAASLRVAAMGDSITAGGYPEELSRMLGEEDIDAAVINMGIPGATAGAYAEFLAARRDLLRRLEPSVVLLMLGANDSREDTRYGGPEGFKSAMQNIIRLVEEIFPENVPEIILSTVLPIVPSGDVFTGESLRRIRDDINPQIRLLGKEKSLRVVDNYGYFTDKTSFLADGVHPCGEGSRLLAGNWLEAVRGVKRNPTGLVYGEIFLRHLTGPGHPERPERLEAIMGRLEKENLLDELFVIEPEKAPLEKIAAVHCAEYIKEVEEAVLGEAGYLHSPDTPVSGSSYEAALSAAGGVLRAIDLVMEGRLRNAFCAVRPPGHHALKDRAMGFCLFNNVAVGARHLLDEHGLERVAVVDWDVHHGNGTQEIFCGEPGVLFVSVHRHPFYPGSGMACERGSGAGEGLTLNIPLPAGSGDEDYLSVFRDKIIPALYEYSPDFILISAGFDAHKDDPLGGMRVSGEGFESMTKMLKEAAERLCGGRIVSLLEGGYDLEGLSDSVYRHLRVLSE